MSAMPEYAFGAAANDADAQETREWLDALSAVIAAEGGERAHFLLEQLHRPGAPGRHRRAVLGQHRLRQHDPDRPGRAHARATSRSRSACAPTCAGTRWRWSSRPTACIRPTAATSAATSRASPRWRRCSAPASTTSGTPRATSHGGDLLYIQGHSLARHLCARLHGRPPQRRAAAQLPPGSRRQGHLELSASEADARVLAVPDRVDGPRAR